MYYFVSDIHLGGGAPHEAKAAEELFVGWLESVKEHATGIFICGDLFDFWYEYKRVVPKGFVRTLAKLAELTSRGIRVVFMAGNHDQWVRDYLSVECGVEIYTTPQRFTLEGKQLYVAHGDNLNVKGDPLLKIMNSAFRSKFVRWAFSSLIHPDLALKFGLSWSYSSRKRHSRCEHKGREKALEMLIEHATNIHTTEAADYYIFGHLHTTLNYTGQRGERVIITNDWSETPHCAVLDEEGRITLEEIS